MEFYYIKKVESRITTNSMRIINFDVINFRCKNRREILYHIHLYNLWESADEDTYSYYLVHIFIGFSLSNI